MPRLDESRLALLDALRNLDVPLSFPGGGTFDQDRGHPFEAMVSVALGLIAEPRVALAALTMLRDAGLLEPEALAGIDPLELDDLLKTARVRLAARALQPLRKLARWAADRGWDAGTASTLSTETIREEWRALNGVGPATADALLLFALGRPTFPVDRASYRVFVRHGWLDPSADRDEARSVLEGVAPDDAEALAQLSLGLEKIGRVACKPTVALCERCPLQPFLPEDGPREG